MKNDLLAYRHIGISEKDEEKMLRKIGVGSLDAAALPLSTADLTAPTSPRTITVTSPDPIFSVPTSATSAAFVIASAASIAAVSPLVSTIPKASCAIVSSS